jgi:hypothetical protein
MPFKPSVSELKKGSAELLILSLLEARARHGYEISKMIEVRSAGDLRFNAASLYPCSIGWNSADGLRADNAADGASGASATIICARRFSLYSRPARRIAF